MASAEQIYWADQAALLDPNAYVLKEGSGWTLTVPLGKTWYLLNGWALRKDGAPYDNFKWHHRDLDTREAMQLPAGFKLSCDDAGYAYYADPSLVQAGDARYVDDPKGLYFERLERLQSAELHMIATHRPFGTAWDAMPTHTNNLFPTDHTRMLLRHVDCHDGCWVILYNGTATTLSRALNTQHELDDIRPMRLTRTMLAPIKSSDYNGIWLGHGNIAGDPSGTQTYNGWGSLFYNVLPSDW